MKFTDLTEQKANSANSSSVMDMLHYFGDFVSIIDDTNPDSDLYIDTLKNTRKPDELMQISLDFIRCTYEPNPLGTWFLNGNPEFLDDAINKDTGNIAYCSTVFSANDGFDGHYQKVISPLLESQGFDINQSHKAFAIITASKEYLTRDLVESASDVLIDNFTFDEEGHHSIVHTGFCRDDALGDLVRVSMMVVSDS